MLRLRRGLLAAVLLLTAGAGVAHAALAPTGALVHGTCTISSLSVHQGAGSFSASGSGSCVANGVSTSGFLTVSGPLDVDLCGAKLGSGTASLALDGGFPQLIGSARLVEHGTTNTFVFAGGLSGAGSFVELLRGTCPTQTVWTGTIAF